MFQFPGEGRGGNRDNNGRGWNRRGGGDNFRGSREYGPGRGPRRGNNGNGPWRGYGGGANSGWDLISQQRGIGNNIPDQSNGLQINDDDIDENAPPQRHQRRQEREWHGPVFGFKRIYGYLDLNTDQVILSINKDLTEWGTFLNSPELTARSSTFLHLVLKVLAEKICQDTMMGNQQIGILIATNSPSFIEKINNVCSSILNQGALQIQRRLPNQSSSFMDVDESPEVFLKHLHTYCEFFMKKMPHAGLDRFYSLATFAFLAITARETTAQGESKTKFAELRDSYQALRAEMEVQIQKLQDKVKVKEIMSHNRRHGFTHEEEEELHGMEAPDDFREIPVVPSVQELMSREEVFLRPNKKTGAYIDANHYLDVQFRLLREDFVQPLKKGVQDFMKHRFEYLSGKKKIPPGTIRLYSDVQIVGSEMVREFFVYKVQLQEHNYKKIKWDKSKRLLTGSLLVFTSDCYDTAHFATLFNRNIDDLKKGILSVTWEGQPPIWDKDDEYLVIECEVYFEAYRHNLEILKQLELEGFPMCKFIVEASSDVNPPKYLENAEELMKFELKNGTEKFISPLTLELWPTKDELGLDENQFTAFQAALTKEFAIIQGPPGTGKTFLGLKIAEVFLNNENIWAGDPETKGPILVVCYTNHALDQFMEGILDVFEKLDVPDPQIVRVGGRSKAERLQPYSLMNVVRRKSMPRDYYANFYGTRDTINYLRNQRSRIMDAIIALRDLQGIINFTRLDVWEELMIEFPSGIFNCMSDDTWFGLQDDLFTHPYFDEESALRRVFAIHSFPRGKVKKALLQEPKKENSNNFEEAHEDEEDYDVDELLQVRLLEDNFAESDAKSMFQYNSWEYRTYIDGLSLEDTERKIQNIRSVAEKIQGGRGSNKSFAAAAQDISKLEHQILIHQNRSRFLEKLFEYYKNGQLDLPDGKEALENYKAMEPDLVESSLRAARRNQRWSIYFAIAEKARELSAKKVADLEATLITEQKKAKEIQMYGDGHVLQNSAVVGMTTTGAAKYNDLVKIMRSKIVIVEEAAEVLESHIVTCITKCCEHLILIGDHRQLRPSTTVYDLSRKFNLDVSLFERMINNNLNCYQLKVQHRMRPEIANLVVDTIYEELHNDASVHLYPPVRGVTKNLFFLKHSELENDESDSMTKSNSFEAKFLAEFCRYLILQGYEPSQITILTTYTGQMFLLKKEIRALSNCQGVRITVVDNFQGEENDIILLSLVRSNLDSKIGFLNIDNRICVALSRAKHGMYILGNMNQLAAKSKTWAAIREKLEDRNECGPALTIECSIHETKSTVTCSQDFLTKCPDGGCTVPCEAVLPCTHHCRQVCHPMDREHKEYKCMKACLKSCANQPPHPCRSYCFQECPPCPEKIIKIFPCQHEKLMECHKDPNEVECEELITKKLPCGHEALMTCYRDTASFTCRIEVEKELHCGHKRTVQCHIGIADLICRVQVEKELPCGHKQMADCRFLPEVIKCDTRVEKILDDCGHKVDVRCGEKDKIAQCKMECPVRLNCGHSCTKICHVAEDPEHLAYICTKDCGKTCTEDHECTGKHKCHLPCPPCNVNMLRNLNCGHIAELNCSVDIQAYECLSPCEKILPCLHKCQSLCSMDCAPCQVVVKVEIDECKHAIEIPCSVRPTQDLCMELVKPDNLSLCSHNTLVPCRVRRTATPAEIMGYCKQPCQVPFTTVPGGCDHNCLGSCSDCMQGRFHVKCEEECGKPLVCGHVCDFPCAKACPPCKKNCVMKCEHSECKKPCGTPCTDCNERCPWQCEHKRCTKRCREPCNREPCNEPCPKTIEKCGHPCIGFCGEPCPPQCRICDKEELTEFILYGNEEDEDARFVYLPDCKHSIEVDGLDHYMKMSEGKEAIGFKACPRCKTVIRYCRRFSTTIRARAKDVILVKKKIFGSQQNVKRTQNAAIRKLAWENDKGWTRYLGAVRDFLQNQLVRSVPVRKGAKEERKVPKEVDEWTMSSLSVILEFAEGALKVLQNVRKDLLPELMATLLRRYRELFANIMSRKIPLSNVEIRDSERELERLFDLNQVYKIRSAPQFYDGHPRALPIYNALMELMDSHLPYTEVQKQKVRELLMNLEEVLKTGLGITDMEKRQILAAMEMQQGHWFKCPNGHVYCIADCGGAMEVSKCNECGARIGGENHAVLGDNQLASEMDGARAPAWPPRQ